MIPKRARKQETDNTISDSKAFFSINGEVIELLPAAQFKIKLDSGQDIIGYLSGKMRLNKIKLLPGDRVVVQMTPYDLKRGRIVYRG